MRYRAIQAHDRGYPIRLMCRALTVSPAGYYAWAGRQESDRSVCNRALLSAILVAHQESRETYGSPRIWDALVKQGHHPIPASVPRGREHLGSCLHRRGSQTGVGWRPDLRLDPGGLALSGDPT
jgi:putative transposase